MAKYFMILKKSHESEKLFVFPSFIIRVTRINGVVTTPGGVFVRAGQLIYKNIHYY